MYWNKVRRYLPNPWSSMTICMSELFVTHTGTNRRFYLVWLMLSCTAASLICYPTSSLYWLVSKVVNWSGRILLSLGI
ncbi:uncharacterized protein BDW43DRAFT_267863 [Aspergillus alliaceus]|uniref:uncharacterized protein n=1 Tax=Petromyces alliaceus TaxID=209559 RepID=UPI0012A54D84|nr:uncharacterized protein BDW43DRAFT_267863 [Aspergillus alliaceus]KAB8236220.1 hypothetical protein BDW43DRAFT_267863 [Aspergillus alliaceus]